MCVFVRAKLSWKWYGTVVFHKLCRRAQCWRVQNTVSVNDRSCIVRCNEFHSAGPETARLLCPYVVVV